MHTHICFTTHRLHGKSRCTALRASKAPRGFSPASEPKRHKADSTSATNVSKLLGHCNQNAQIKRCKLTTASNAVDSNTENRSENKQDYGLAANVMYVFSDTM